ncbi:MAG TPA: sugar ABC transporter ATP-binding protein, partial [Candidatus Poseidoniales archaeon]
MMPDFTQTGRSEDAASTQNNNVPVVVFKNVSKQYGQISALTDISLAISGGVTGILGLNGAGKSTL